MPEYIPNNDEYLEFLRRQSQKKQQENLNKIFVDLSSVEEKDKEYIEEDIKRRFKIGEEINKQGGSQGGSPQNIDIAAIKPDIPVVQESEVKKDQEKIKEENKKKEKIKEEKKSTRKKNFLEGAIYFRIAIEPYVLFDVGGHNEIWRMDSDKFKKYYRWRKMKELGANYDEREITDELNRKIGEVTIEAPEYVLHTRVASGKDGNNKEIFYDLTNEKWEIVKITPHPDGMGWNIEETSQPLFYRWGHQDPQIYPSRIESVGEAIGNISKLFYSKNNKNGLIRLRDKEDRILYVIDLISKFIPSIEHCINIIIAPAGTQKSYAEKIKKLIVDPSKVIAFGRPEKYDKELVQQVFHHWLACYDNCNQSFPNSVSDFFSRVCTGGYDSKRKLFSDDEDFIRSLDRHCISVNGITSPLGRSDVLSRVILFELDTTYYNKRSTNELDKQFNDIRSKLLGSIFLIISKAMYIKPNVKLNTNLRMVNFIQWGYAIAEVMNIGGQKFYEIYDKKVKEMNDITIEDDIVAKSITIMLSDKERDGEYDGTYTKLINALEFHIFNDYLAKDTTNMKEYETKRILKELDFPTNPKVLGERISNIIPNLKLKDIEVERYAKWNDENKRSEKRIRIRKI